jgi:putative tryptophan/tyrosine transport system substrate-binding protein
LPTSTPILLNRREFTVGVLTAAAAGPAWAQQPATHRLAILHPAIPAALITEDSFWRAFFVDPRRLGYTEGENLIVDRYSAEGHHERYADLAREIVTSHPDVIVTVSIKVVIALLAATDTIPIVANMLEDPMKAGLVSSLARPGVNLTGVSRDAGGRDLGEAPANFERSCPFGIHGRLSGVPGDVGRPFRAGLAERPWPVSDFADGMLLH